MARSSQSSIKRLDTAHDDFDTRLAALTRWASVRDHAVEVSVREIIDAVRTSGDEAVIELTNRFDKRSVTTMAELMIDDFSSMRKMIDSALDRALETAADRIRSFHEHQLQRSWDYEEADGTVLGQLVTPLDRVGVYVPGGKAAYPSSVLMNVIPAKIAGVKNIIMMVPAPAGQLEPVVLAAAEIAGVDKVYSIGGAQAIAALAYGTETLSAVDKIVGPGNIYVATAKSLVFGTVGIDMIAGPSEILIVCDGTTDPDWVTMDLFCQAEHDEDAQAILICPDTRYLNAVAESIDRLMAGLERREIIAASLRTRGALIKVRDLDEAMDLVNRIAPEHLELSVENPRDLLPKVRHAGAIFLGRYSAEALGDYCAGPNHVLPTSGSARFFSPLGVYDFQKRSSIIECSAAGAARLAGIAATLADGEGLTAHARSAAYRGHG
ncbi:MAG: histidinol dehydrogenase [Proteobacteria bacterium]|nr:MAG: histidinol dehydrogenase [Pseudomonadota bacterium]